MLVGKAEVQFYFSNLFLNQQGFFDRVWEPNLGIGKLLFTLLFSKCNPIEFYLKVGLIKL